MAYSDNRFTFLVVVVLGLGWASTSCSPPAGGITHLRIGVEVQQDSLTVVSWEKLPGTAPVSPPSPKSLRAFVPRPEQIGPWTSIVAVSYDSTGHPLDIDIRSVDAPVFLDDFSDLSHGGTVIANRTRFLFEVEVLEGSFLLIFRTHVPRSVPRELAGSLTWDEADSLANYPWIRRLASGDGYSPAGLPRSLGVTLLRAFSIGRPAPWTKAWAGTLQLANPFGLPPISPFHLDQIAEQLRKRKRRASLREDWNSRFFDNSVHLRGERLVTHPLVAPFAGNPYRIAILGDGFDADEGDDFLALAQAFAVRLVKVPPFKDLADRIEIWIVPTVSEVSGISYCDSDDELETYFGVRSCYKANKPGECQPPLGAPKSFLGVDDAGRVLIRKTAEAALAADKQIHCHLVIANCDTDGGRADLGADWRIAFAGRPRKDPSTGVALTGDEQVTRFVDIAIHECAHVMARLADEYMFCAPWEAATEHPNMATLAQIETGDIPWAALADELEIALNPSHLSSVLPCTDIHNSPSMTTASAFALGAYWGCGYAGTAYEQAGPLDRVAHTCDPWNDPWGEDFFRPEGTCRMRMRNFGSFCLPCAAALELAIKNPPEYLP